MYTEKEQQLIEHVARKVEALFFDYHVPAHGIDHVSRVVYWAKQIADGEQATHPFLCELAAWTHDIGRTREDHRLATSRSHHELSYEMLKEWYREDLAFDVLTDNEKIEVLYAVRYHWNDVADAYESAWILRDADKLDGFGDVGLTRAEEYFGFGTEEFNEKGFSQNFRNLYQTLYHVRTQTARQFIETKNLIDPIDHAHEKYLKKQIKEIVL